jgi:hypothetical protein
MLTGLTTSIFERPATLVHLVLLAREPWQKVLVTRFVHLLLETAGRERPLFALKNVKVVVGGVQAGVAFRAEWCTKEYEVFGDASMDDVHGTHSASGVVENPVLLLVVGRSGRGGVDVEMDTTGSSRVGRREVREDVRHHSIRVVGIQRDSLPSYSVKLSGVEDVPPLLNTRLSLYHVECRLETLTLMPSRKVKASNRTAMTPSRVIHLLSPETGAVVLGACFALPFAWLPISQLRDALVAQALAVEFKS